MKPSASVISLNAEAPQQDGKRWLHLLPAGTFTGIDGRGPYDASDQEGIALASRDYAGRREMVLDYNHATDLQAKHGGPAIAAGWIVGLQTRADGIWGLTELTERAAAHIDAREYRYLSPVFRHSNDGKVTAILRASLTNVPNLDQLTALASAEDEPMDALLARLRELLGFGPDADQETIVAAIGTRLTAAHQAIEPDPAKYVPIGQFQRTLAELNTLRQGVSKKTAEEHVDKHIDSGRVLPWMRDWAVSLCMSNLPAFDEFVAGVGPGFVQLRTHSHTGGQPRGNSGADALTSEIAANMGFKPDEFAAYRAKTEQGK